MCSLSLKNVLSLLLYYNETQHVINTLQLSKVAKFKVKPHNYLFNILAFFYHMTLSKFAALIFMYY